MTLKFHISELDLSSFLLVSDDWGDDMLSYAKREVSDQHAVWGVYDGFGNRLGTAASREKALTLIEHNDLIAQSVH